MTDIAIVNDNGTIKGIDQDTGAQVDIEFDGVSFSDIDELVTDPLEETLDADFNDIENVASLDSETVTTEEASIGEQIKMADEPLTIYVRSDGDDDNTGLSESDAKETIEGAVDALPRIGVGVRDGERVTIDLEPGASYSIDTTIDIIAPHISEIQLRGGSDRPTVEINGGIVGFHVVRTKVRFDLIDILSSHIDAVPIRGQSQATIEIRNVSLSGKADHFINALQQSTIDIHDSVTVNGDSDSFGCRPHSSSHMSIRGEITGCDTAVWIGRGSTAIVSGHIHHNDVAVEVEDGGAGKTGRFAEIVDNGIGFDVRENGFFKVWDFDTVENNAVTYNPREAGVIKTEDFDTISGLEYEPGADDIGASFGLNETRQNETDYKKWVFVTIEATADDTNINASLSVSDSESNVDSADAKLDQIRSEFQSSDRGTMTALVPAGWYYRVRAFGDTSNYQIDELRERRWITPY